MDKQKRAVGIVIKNDVILLIRRIREGKEYFVFPGGGVEDGETVETAVLREIKEELSLDAKIDHLLFQIFNPVKVYDIEGRDEYYFLITKFEGEPKLGGPEKERMNEKDQYYLEWHKLSELKDLKNLYPEEARQKIIALDFSNS